jgi:RHS repeat-associated protein
VERYAYSVYGSAVIRDTHGEILNASSVGNPYFFTGRRLDTETRLYYYRARYYSPTLGRFVQADPIGYQGGINLYTYCRSNPIVLTDPFGLCGDEFIGFDSWSVWRDLPWHLFDGINDGVTFAANTWTAGLVDEWSEQAAQAKARRRYGWMGTASEVSAGVAGVATLGAGALELLGVDVVLWGTAAGTAAASNPESIRVVGNAITGFQGSTGPNPFHGIDQAITRGVSPQAILDTLRDPVIKVQQGARMLYISEKAAVVLDAAGQVVTTWGCAQFNQQTMQLLQGGT